MTQPRRIFRKLVKFLAYGSAVVVVALAVAHFAWKYSGSNQWELWRDKKGVAVYTLKAPGSTRLQFKVVTRINTTLDRVVAAMTDTTTDGCQAMIRGCTSGRIFKTFDPRGLHYIQAYRIDIGPPFSPRDLVLKTQVSRDPRTKALLVDVTSVPELIASDGCCVRMTELKNRWRFTPLENGTIELEFTQNDDPVVPYPLYNRLVRNGHTWMRRNMERVFNREKYQHAEFAFLREL